jgi:hypothetical protein|tara:strand:+ start:160 stop:507 length:348 start_codon:yes stop_codon:yes gene_type:complete
MANAGSNLGPFTLTSKKQNIHGPVNNPMRSVQTKCILSSSGFAKINLLIPDLRASPPILSDQMFSQLPDLHGIDWFVFKSSMEGQPSIAEQAVLAWPNTPGYAMAFEVSTTVYVI